MTPARNLYRVQRARHRGPSARILRGRPVFPGRPSWAGLPQRRGRAGCGFARSSARLGDLGEGSGFPVPGHAHRLHTRSPVFCCSSRRTSAWSLCTPLVAPHQSANCISGSEPPHQVRRGGWRGTRLAVDGSKIPGSDQAETSRGAEAKMIPGWLNANRRRSGDVPQEALEPVPAGDRPGAGIQRVRGAEWISLLASAGRLAIERIGLPPAAEESRPPVSSVHRVLR